MKNTTQSATATEKKAFQILVDWDLKMQNNYSSIDSAESIPLDTDSMKLLAETETFYVVEYNEGSYPCINVIAKQSEEVVVVEPF